MKKLIFGLSLLLVAVASLFIFSGNTNTNTVTEDNNEAQVTECAKKDKGVERDGDPDDGVTLN